MQLPPKDYSGGSRFDALHAVAISSINFVIALDYCGNFRFDFPQNMIDSGGDGATFFPDVVVGLFLLDIQVENFKGEFASLAELTSVRFGRYEFVQSVHLSRALFDA
jgi:hypothetical protein